MEEARRRQMCLSYVLLLAISSLACVLASDADTVRFSFDLCVCLCFVCIGVLICLDLIV